MKYRNKKLTKIQKNMRKFPRIVQNLYLFYGIRQEKRKTRWRQLKKARKQREKQ